jgi:putative ABC transport system ATP-binding protein
MRKRSQQPELAPDPAESSTSGVDAVQSSTNHLDTSRLDTGDRGGRPTGPPSTRPELAPDAAESANHDSPRRLDAADPGQFLVPSRPIAPVPYDYSVDDRWMNDNGRGRVTSTAERTIPVGAADDTVPVIELVDVSKIYRTGDIEVAALRDVSMRIEENEFVAITGPSGSGKSTLMHILGCLDVPTSGVFRLAGHDVQTFDENQLADVRNRFIGFVFQQFNLLAYLSAWRNVELPLVYAKVRPAERKARALAALDVVGLADRANHKPGELSGGQQQRVAVARALVTEPGMLLADEPTGNLDSVATTDILALLDELHRAGRTIVLITHENDVAARAQRTVMIRDGGIYVPEPVGARR